MYLIQAGKLFRLDGSDCCPVLRQFAQEEVLHRHTVWFDLAPDGDVLGTDRFTVTSTAYGERFRTDDLISSISSDVP